MYTNILYHIIGTPKPLLATLAEGYFHSIYSPFLRFPVEKPQK